MPVFSYLAMPAQGAKGALEEELKAMPYCEVIPADNVDVLVLLTDTPDEKTQQDLLQQLHRLPSLQSLSMAFGCSDELQPER
jgi:nitrate reductase NapAB chaperone NapD